MREIGRTRLGMYSEGMPDEVYGGNTPMRQTERQPGPAELIRYERETGKPVHNAIVWQCRRTADICRALEEKGYGPVIRRKTGLLLDAYFSGTKVKWLLDNVPGLRKRANRGEICFGTVDSWLIYNLTGEHVTDVSNASRTSVSRALNSAKALPRPSCRPRVSTLMTAERSTRARGQGTSSTCGRRADSSVG